MSDFTLLDSADVKQRMQCSGNIAARIESEFVTVEQLLDAIEANDALSDRDGIGPATEETILEWYDNRFEREEQARSATINRTSDTSMSIRFHTSWETALAGGDGQ